MSDYTLLLGDAVTVLRTLPAGSVQCAITSPPYFGLRSYLPDGHTDKAAELGGEDTPEAYVARMVEVFREVRRVLRDDGTLWLNLGDSYANDGKWGGETGGKQAYLDDDNRRRVGRERRVTGLKPKDLIGIPWMVAFALRADGWWLRQELIWHKLAPMPESVTDRCTKAHEQVFLLAKSATYYYDQEAIREPQKESSLQRMRTGWNGDKKRGYPGSAHNNFDRYMGKTDEEIEALKGANKRSVWSLNPEPSSMAHYAVMPTKLVEPCVLAGSSQYGACSQCGAPWERVVEREGGNYAERKANGAGGPYNLKPELNRGKGHIDAQVSTVTTGWQPTCLCAAPVVPCTVLDPFAGSGTTLAVALKFGRRAIGIDLDSRNLELAHKRIARMQPMLLGME